MEIETITKKKEIWKFEISTSTILEMPVNAEILTVQNQRTKTCIWALVDPKAPTVSRRFETYGTGQEITYSKNTNRKYIGTFQLYHGDLVFHLFEINP